MKMYRPNKLSLTSFFQEILYVTEDDAAQRSDEDGYEAVEIFTDAELAARDKALVERIREKLTSIVYELPSGNYVFVNDIHAILDKVLEGKE